MAFRIGVPRMRVLRTLHLEDLYPFHDQRVQHLEPGDCAQRMDLCHWIQAHRELLDVILFTDEATFTRDGVNNLRNVHTWSHDNPHATTVTNFQRRFSLNVIEIRNHPDNIASAIQSLLIRAENCLANGGGHFEQLL
jgi:hypothetical protein